MQAAANSGFTACLLKVFTIWSRPSRGLISLAASTKPASAKAARPQGNHADYFQCIEFGDEQFIYISSLGSRTTTIKQPLNQRYFAPRSRVPDALHYSVSDRSIHRFPFVALRLFTSRAT